MERININGQVFNPETEPDKIKISVFDRGFLFGDSIYEVIKTQNRKMIFWPEHFRRLQESANRLSMELPFTENEITKEIIKTLKELNIDEAYMRLVVTRGEGGFSLDISDTRTRGNFVIFTRSLSKIDPIFYEKGAKLIIANTQRNSIKALDPKIKSGNYLNNLLAHREAKEAGIYDSLMLNERGEITEGPTFNIFLIKDNVFYTPALESGLLKGITRRMLIESLSNANLSVKEQILTKQDLLNADEVFACSSTKELVPIVAIDNKVYGEKPGEGFIQASKIYKNFRDRRAEADNLSY